jgi:prepilin-type processing-associated H-X9-DG protein
MGPVAAQIFLDPGMELRMLSANQARQVCLRKAQEPNKHGYIHPKLQKQQPGATGASAAYPAIGEYWAFPYPNRGTWVNGLLPPNSPNFLGRHLGSRHGRDAAFGLRPASSWHVGGVNLGYADGSVRFVTNDVNPGEYTGRFSIDRGEITGDEEYYTGGCAR